MATRHGSSPALSCSSTTSRSSRASEPWCARAIVLVGELVQPQREPLGAAPVVDEDERRAVLADELEQLRVDRRPDRLARRLLPPCERIELDVRSAPARPSTPPARGSSGRAACARRCRRSCTSAWGRPGSGRPPRAGSAWRTGRSAGRRGRPASASRSSVSARCAPRLVCATAWISSRITCSVPSKIFARLAGEHQVQRLRRGDQDVRRVPDHVAAAPSAACRRCGSPTFTSAPMPAQRRAQVLLDVVAERLQRRDVDEPRPLGGRLGDEAVERPQERRQRLARAGRRGDQRVLAGRDRRPRLRLRGRRRRERPLEPLTDLRRERFERHSSEGTSVRGAFSGAPHTIWNLSPRRGVLGVMNIRFRTIARKMRAAHRRQSQDWIRRFEGPANR